MIGGKSYDDYLREQERKNRGQGLSGGSTYRPEVPEVEETSHMTQTPPAKKKMQPVSLFFIMFGIGISNLYRSKYRRCRLSALGANQLPLTFVLVGPYL